MKVGMSVVVILVVVLGGCGDNGDGNAGADNADAPDEVTGIITEVESSGLNEVTSFRVKSGDEEYEILIDDSVDYGFPLGHLDEHHDTADPVTVALEERDGELYAQSIEDAPAPAPAS